MTSLSSRVSPTFLPSFAFPMCSSIQRTTKKLCGNRHSLEMHRCIWNCALWLASNFHRSTKSWLVDGRLVGYIGDIHFALRFSCTLLVLSGLTSTFAYNSKSVSTHFPSSSSPKLEIWASLSCVSFLANNSLCAVTLTSTFWPMGVLLDDVVVVGNCITT